MCTGNFDGGNDLFSKTEAQTVTLEKTSAGMWQSSGVGAVEPEATHAVFHCILLKTILPTLCVFSTAFKINIPRRRWEQSKSVRELAEGCGKP